MRRAALPRPRRTAALSLPDRRGLAPVAPNRAPVAFPRASTAHKDAPARSVAFRQGGQAQCRLDHGSRVLHSAAAARPPGLAPDQHSTWPSGHQAPPTTSPRGPCFHQKAGRCFLKGLADAKAARSAQAATVATGRIRRHRHPQAAPSARWELWALALFPRSLSRPPPPPS